MQRPDEIRIALLGPGAEPFTKTCQPHPPAGSFEQLPTNLPFEARYGLAYPPLRNSQSRGGAPKMQLIGYRQKGFDITEFHDCPQMVNPCFK